MPPKMLDRSGQRFSRLTVISFKERRGNHKIWTCRCDCGAIKDVSGASLAAGSTKSCGCYTKERMSALGITKRRHGGRRTSEWEIWQGIKKRCLNKNCAAYKWYGGRGITICERWRISFENFLADVGPRPSKQHSIDRIDNDGNYEPSNCRWATATEQAYNRRPKRGVAA
jgi:hypothetical protein